MTDTAVNIVDHLRELRQRIMYALLAVLVGFAFCYSFASEIYGFLVQPLADVSHSQVGRKMIYTGLAEAFFTYVKVSFLAGFTLAFPIVAYQAWAFIAPGLYKEEKRALWPYVMSAPILFLAGASLAYFVVIPLAWQFFIGFENPQIAGEFALEMMPRVSQYLGIVIKMLFAFGLCFQLPVVLTLLARIGVTSSKALAAKRKHALVIVLIVSAIMTPPDVFSQILLSLPVMLLYEASIFLAKLVEKKKSPKGRKS